MPDRKFVKDIMLEIFEYPHIPYWFSIEQVIKVMKAFFLQAQKYTDPLVVLVFDEKYNLIGTVSLKEVLKGIASSFINSPAIKQSLEEKKEIDWDKFFGDESKKFLQKSVSEIMVPTKHFIDPSDPITKAAYLMINFDLPVLPVIEDKRKLIGVVRIFEIFDVISNEIIKNKKN